MPIQYISNNLRDTFHDKHYIIHFRYAICVDRLQGMMKRLSSRPFLILFIFSTVPVGCTLISLVYIMIVWNKLTFAPLFDNNEMFIADPTSSLKWICFVAIVPFIFLIICVAEYYQWCNISFIRDLRANDRRKAVLSFISFFLTFCVVYLPISGLHIRTFYLMKNYEISANGLLFNLHDFKQAPYSNKMQVFFDCCGINNYTDWSSKIPHSCCIDLKKHNCTENVSDIFQTGCLKSLNAFVNVQVRGQTFYVQVHCLAVGVILLLIGVMSLLFARKVYYKSIKSAK